MTIFKSSIVAIGLIVLSGAGAVADVFVVDPSSDGDTVNFRSTAKLEFIEGSTTDLNGQFEFNPNSTGETVTGRLRVDLRTLKTGIETRDRHMRENHLETEEYPYAYFEFTSLNGLPTQLELDSAYQAMAVGFFYIHGVKRSLEADLVVRYGNRGSRQSLVARATFSIKLDDYRIERPKALFLKLAETIEVEVIFTSFNDLSESTVILPDWETIP